MPLEIPESKELNRPTELGRLMGSELARLTEKADLVLRAGGRPMPEPCRSCAFRSGTIPNGREETVMDALKCVLERKHVFMCHEFPAGGEPTTVCAGYAIAMAATVDTPPLQAPWEFSEP